jgi:acetoacetate decarboxylase
MHILGESREMPAPTSSEWITITRRRRPANLQTFVPMQLGIDTPLVPNSKTYA